MLMKQIIDAYEVLDSSFVTGEAVKEYLLGIKEDANVEVYELVGTCLLYTSSKAMARELN